MADHRPAAPLLINTRNPCCSTESADLRLMSERNARSVAVATRKQLANSVSRLGLFAQYVRYRAGEAWQHRLTVQRVGGAVCGNGSLLVVGGDGATRRIDHPYQPRARIQPHRARSETRFRRQRIRQGSAAPHSHRFAGRCGRQSPRAGNPRVPWLPSPLEQARSGCRHPGAASTPRQSFASARSMDARLSCSPPLPPPSDYRRAEVPRRLRVYHVRRAQKHTG